MSEDSVPLGVGTYRPYGSKGICINAGMFHEEKQGVWRPSLKGSVGVWGGHWLAWVRLPAGHLLVRTPRERSPHPALPPIPGLRGLRNVSAVGGGGQAVLSAVPAAAPEGLSLSSGELSWVETTRLSALRGSVWAAVELEAQLMWP